MLTRARTPVLTWILLPSSGMDLGDAAHGHAMHRTATPSGLALYARAFGCCRASPATTDLHETAAL